MVMMPDVLWPSRFSFFFFFSFAPLLHHLLLLLLLALSGSARAGEDGGVACPEACTCGVSEVRCENSRAMQDIPRLLPHNDTLQRLLVSRVNLTAVPNGSFPFLGRLTSLDLNNNNIKTLADAAFVQLPLLTRLVLRRNSLSQLSGDTFLGLTQLKELDLSWNCLMELHGGRFRPLEGLHVLDLARNKIHPVMSDAFQGLGQLRVLNLTRNQLTNLSGHFLAPLTSLTTLVADDNSISSIDDNSFLSLPALTHLSLNGNMDLKHVQPEAFVTPPSTLGLRELWLKGTHLTQVPVATLKTLPALRTLDLSQTRISVIRAGSFSEQGQLLNLTLDSLPALAAIHADAFKGLRSLETLVISNNPVLANISWGVFRNLSSLRYLDLHRNSLETVYAGMANWHNIRVVDLRDNPLRCDCNAGWVLSLLKEPGENKNGSKATGSGATGSAVTTNTNTNSSSSSTCTNSSAPAISGSAVGEQVVSTAAFARQIRCHMPPRLHNRCLTSLTAHDFQCPRTPEPRTRRKSDDNRLMVAALSAGLVVVLLVTCGLVLKFRRRLCSACGRQYRYTAHRSNGVNGSSPQDIVELETTQLEDFDSDMETTNMRP